jgi:hypothetical protein
LILALLVAVGPQPAADASTIAVPFLPQTEALCGGAAAAMVLRYWGDRHASVQQFAALVDARAGGIPDTALIADIRAKGWIATRSEGSLSSLRAHLDARRPVILLLEDRPGRYHYVVAVGANDRQVLVHDPTWGPSRSLAAEALTRAWKPSGFWMLVVTPGARPGNADSLAAGKSNPAPRTSSAALVETDGNAASTPCDRLLNAALDEISERGLDVADAALAGVRERCPDSPAVPRELAGVRFAQARWQDAAALARDTLARDASDRYAWDVLGSSLFLLSDPKGALTAWNHAGRPTLDLVRIEGLTRARYSLIAHALGLVPGALLSARAFGLAERRLAELPDRVSSRVTLEPDADGYATVRASLRETSRIPRTLPEWAAAVTETLINREIASSIAGGLGQGEVWTARWRWWENRPRIAGGFSAPVGGPLGGVWHVEAAREIQTYAVDEAGGRLREERRSAAVGLRNWATPSLRYDIRAGFDVWNLNRRTVAGGGTIEWRLAGDRLAADVSVDRSWGLRGAEGFSTASAGAQFHSSLDPAGWVGVAAARVDVASTGAPLAVWSGAGEGRARPGLLRAHRLHHDGVIDGSVFGRRVVSSNVELQRWFQRRIGSIGIALFTDAARASERIQSGDASWLVDSGVGLRARPPALDGTLRLDYAHGIGTRAARLTVGWAIAIR